MNGPPLLDMVVEDCTGEGVPADQLAKSCSNYVLAFGRAGLMIDYPVMDAPATKDEVALGEIRATFKLYPPWTIAAL